MADIAKNILLITYKQAEYKIKIQTDQMNNYSKEDKKMHML